MTNTHWVLSRLVGAYLLRSSALSGLRSSGYPTVMTTTAIERLERSVKTLTPGYFAVTMASGIVSVGMEIEGFTTLSVVLLVVCAASFVVLLALTSWRAISYPGAIRDDFMDPRRAFGFFTLVAGADVLGVRLFMAGYAWFTSALLLVAGATFLVIGYVIPWTAALSKQKQSVVATANGTWFIWVVASQSIAIAAATLEPGAGSARAILALVAVVGVGALGSGEVTEVLGHHLQARTGKVPSHRAEPIVGGVASYAQTAECTDHRMHSPPGRLTTRDDHDEPVRTAAAAGPPRAAAADCRRQS